MNQHNETLRFNNHFLLANDNVEHISYIPFKEDRTEGVKHMDIIRRDE